MLDTDIPAVSAHPRPGARRVSATVSQRTASKPRVSASVSPRPAAAPKPGRLARSETRLLAFAVTATVIVCGLLVLYLAAYARVSRLGMDLSKHRVELHALQQQNQLLQAQAAGLENPQRITAAALKQGMKRDDSRADYLPQRPSTPSLSRTSRTDGQDNGLDMGGRAARPGADIQGANDGEANDNTKTASSNH